MLANPVIMEAVNMEAARMYLSSPSLYRQTVLDCVLASKRIDGECFTSQNPIYLLFHEQSSVQSDNSAITEVVFREALRSRSRHQTLVFERLNS